MKKFVSIKTQRIIMFIPFANAFILFVWLYNFGRSNQPNKIFMKSLLTIFATTIPLIIIRIFLEKLLFNFPYMIQILHYLTLYFIPFCMAYSLIKFQQKYLINDN